MTQSPSPPLSVTVVGAGITGLCAAWSLAERGASVTVVERGQVPAARAASADHHRLIRHPYPDNPGYTARIPEAFAAWRRLWASLGGAESRYLADRGVLVCSQQPGDWGDRGVRRMAEHGVEMERFAPDELARRFPFLETANLGYGVLSPGGALMANRILIDLADALRARGVPILELSPVQAVAPTGEVRLADGRVLTADAVLLSAGAETPRLAPTLFPDLSYSRTLIVYADPPEDLAEAWEGAPCWTDLGGEADLWGMPPIAGLPAKLGCGALRRIDEGDHDRVMKPEEVQAMLGAYAGRFRGIERFSVRFGQANYWMGAKNAEFQLRRDGRLWGLSADSGHGFKFGALTGEDVARALAGEASFESVRAQLAGLAA